MPEFPVLSMMSSQDGDRWIRKETMQTHTFSQRFRIRILGFYLVKVILVELSNEGCEIRMFEMMRKDNFSKLIHVLFRIVRRKHA